MALASLCSKTTKVGNIRPSFTAFIVDHALRQGSHEEAQNVSKLLMGLNIESKILKLDWSQITQDPTRLKNMESMARRLRFQAMGRACRDLGIESLLLAHHADDQAETVMSRLISGYHGSGFRGIQPEARIPECHGIYGVAESGSPYKLHSPKRGPYRSNTLQIESGGVFVHRPLLDFHKDELIATCQQNCVKWFEDPTNKDKGLTIRNTVRHLWGSVCMPAALSSSAMLEMARRAESRHERYEQMTDRLFNRCSLRLDVRSSRVIAVLPGNVETEILALTQESSIPGEAARIGAQLLRKIFMLVTYKSNIALQDLENATKVIFPSLYSNDYDESVLSDEKVTNVAGLSITRDPNFKSQNQTSSSEQEGSGLVIPKTRDDTMYVIHRERPPRLQAAGASIVLSQAPSKRDHSTDPTWTPWRLFDGRFWIRLRHCQFNITPNQSLAVRFLNEKDIAQIRASHTEKEFGTIQKRLGVVAPGSARYTLPVIVERSEVQDADGGMSVQEEIRAIPTIGWETKDWQAWQGKDYSNFLWSWEWRYKMVDFGDSKDHVYVRDKGP